MVDAQTRTPPDAVPDGRHRAGPAPTVLDPLQDVRQLTGRLLAEAERGDWLDAFLLAAGALQVVEHRLQGADRRRPRPAGPAGPSEP
ncbi:hypothetical protein, partial [Kitasatospora nipponensis]|uniref:hypothetical protein n=1 Tax=Kitasatospora nipponensis TaxID=258049 RepID=UPI0031E05DC3